MRHYLNQNILSIQNSRLHVKVIHKRTSDVFETGSGTHWIEPVAWNLNDAPSSAS